MAKGIPTLAVPPPAALSTAVPAAGNFDERWAVWQAKGAAHDRAGRRQIAVLAPILIVIAVVIFVLLGR